MSIEERLAETAQAVRDEVIRRAIDAGVSAYRVAQVTGLSRPAVASARDRAAGD